MQRSVPCLLPVSCYDSHGRIVVRGRLWEEVKKMLTLYLDNNVYDHMVKGRPGAKELRRLLLGRERPRGLSVIPSLENFNEFIPLLSTNQEMFRDALRLMRSIVDWDRPLKPLRSLLIDDVRSFATFQRASTPFAGRGTTVRTLLKHALNVLSSPSAKDVSELKQIGQVIIRDKIDFKKAMDEARQTALASVERPTVPPAGLVEKWRDYVSTQAIMEPLLEPHARAAGRLKKFSELGLLRMLEIPSVHMAVAFDVGLMYSMAFKNRATRASDAGDQHHAIYSSAADVFVCVDRSLRNRLLAIANLPVAVLDIRQTVERLRAL